VALYINAQRNQTCSEKSTLIHYRILHSLNYSDRNAVRLSGVPRLGFELHQIFAVSF